MCSYSGQQCCVKDVSSFFYFELEGSHPSEGAGLLEGQGWWSRQNFNGTGSCSRARVSKLFSSDSGAGHFTFMALTPAPFDLNLAGSGSAPAPLRTKICYKSLIFVYRKKIQSLQNKKISFLACNIISKIIIFYKIF